MLKQRKQQAPLRARGRCTTEVVQQLAGPAKSDKAPCVNATKPPRVTA